MTQRKKQYQTLPENPPARGMSIGEIRYAQRTPVLCPHCLAEKVHVMWYSIYDNVTYYSCHGCGKDFYGSVIRRPSMSIEVHTVKLV